MTSVEPTRIRFNYTVKSVALATLFLCLAAGCTRKAPVQDAVTFEGGIMGTVYHVKVVGSLDQTATAAAAEAIESALQRVDGKMSTYKPDSELSRLNAAPAGAPISVSEETFDVFRLAQQVNAESGGAFDVTVGPLVNAWGFGPPDQVEAPNDDQLATLLALTGADKLTLDAVNHSITKAADGVYCDLSAIAKGYAVDQVCDALAALGHADFMVEVGGEVRTAGLNASGQPWRIAIEKPVDQERVIHGLVGLTNKSLATSGDYRNFYEVEGRRISHTINPKTGRPVDHSLASASVIHPDCALADAYATALMVLGPEAGLAFAEKQGLAVLLILHGDDGHFTTRQTAAFAPYLVSH